MRGTGKTLTNLGARGLLKLLGGLVTLAATTCADYGMPVGVPDTAYGMPPNLDATLGGADAAYGPRVCSTDADCADLGTDWYCGAQDWCLRGEPDAGTDPDAGGDGEADSGQ